jgi:GNAT superfamily N-acetyltransferase
MIRHRGQLLTFCETLHVQSVRLPLQRVSLELGAATPEELPQLVALLGMLFSEEAEFAPDAAKQARALAEILSDDAVGRVYVARESGRIVAMASLLFSISTAEGGLAATFEDLCVLPDRRGRGVGSALLRFVIDEARRHGVLRLTLLTDAGNTRAQALYARCGFRPSGMLPMRLHLKGEEG